MVMDMGLLAVSIYQTRPKSKQELQVTSFNPNATATAVEQPAATEFGPGIAQHWSWKMHEPVPNNFQKSLTPRNWI